MAPRPAASITFTSCFGTITSTSPPVVGFSTSGTMIFDIMMAPGAVMITAVRRWMTSTFATRTYAAMIPPEM